jgi:SNF2 family DNA or RNA helicase
VLNWESEIHKFSPTLTVLPVIGDAEQRTQAIKKSIGYDVVVTSYDLLKRDIEQYKGKEFRYHIIDEAQYIKNHQTQNAKAVKAIDSMQRFALTGTPIENRLSELWSIFDFLMPGFLYGYTRFRERFETPIVKNGDASALERLGKMTMPFVLRRLKREVLKELPEKTESVLVTTMEEEQRKLYMANLVQAKKQLAQDIAQKGFESSKFAVLAMLMRLRQICCDPSLCYEDYTGGSAKLESCMELLKEATGAGHKVLLFSQFTSMLATIQARLQEEGIRFFTLQGSTPKEKRAAMADSFNRDDTEVFLISLKAGGTGLNLTGADVVIHYDPWWNISVQNQATDRAHRIGQKSSVQVYKLIAKDTIEEKILRLQESKRELADAVIQEGDGIITSMTQQQLMDILD